MSSAAMAPSDPTSHCTETARMDRSSRFMKRPVAPRGRRPLEALREYRRTWRLGLSGSVVRQRLTALAAGASRTKRHALTRNVGHGCYPLKSPPTLTISVIGNSCSVGKSPKMRGMMAKDR